MKEYYSKRASEYESIYYRNDPIRQSELDKIKDQLKALFKNSAVLEIASGTGYWTETIVSVAKDNLGSRRVLEKCGFEIIGESKGFANDRGQEIEELLLELGEVSTNSET